MTPEAGKSTDHDHNLISSGGAQDTSTCKLSDYSIHAFFSKCLETSPDGRTDRRTDGQMDGWTCRKMVTVGRMDQRTHIQVKGYFRLQTDGRTEGQTDERTDGQPENIMLPAPKGGGIKNEYQNSMSKDRSQSQQEIVYCQCDITYPWLKRIICFILTAQHTAI